MSNEVFYVSLPSGEGHYVEAKSKAAAKKHVLAGVEVRRVPGSEVLTAQADGIAIQKAE